MEKIEANIECECKVKELDKLENGDKQLIGDTCVGKRINCSDNSQISNRLVKRRRIEFATNDNVDISSVHSRYDPSIVYAVDDILLRGQYNVFVQWFESYFRKCNFPGCVVFTGFSDVRQNVVLSNIEYPYIRIQSTGEYPIFSFKMETSYPRSTILITMENSKLSKFLTCDVCIFLKTTQLFSDMCARISESLKYLNDSYLNYFEITQDDESNTILEKDEEYEEDEEMFEDCDMEKDKNVNTIDNITTEQPIITDNLLNYHNPLEDLYRNNHDASNNKFVDVKYELMNNKKIIESLGFE